MNWIVKAFIALLVAALIALDGLIRQHKLRLIIHELESKIKRLEEI